MTAGTSSLFVQESILSQIFRWLILHRLQFPTGLYVLLAGLVLILVFATLLVFRIASLPLSLAINSRVDSRVSNDGRSVQIVVFLLTAGLPTMLGAAAILLLDAIVRSLSVHLIPQGAQFVLGSVSNVASAVALVGPCILVLGRNGRNAAIRSLRLPEARAALFALLLPIIVYGLSPTGHFLCDRALWAQRNISSEFAPRFSDYLLVRKLFDISLWFLVFGALAEETIFRGMLLTEFLDRYGMHRGIFLTGLAWAALHFRSDSYTGASVGFVIQHLAARIFVCMAMNYVLAWMTLRWHSVIPATITHTVSNILILSKIGFIDSWNNAYTSIFLWGALAWILFRFWPVAETQSLVADSQVSIVEDSSEPSEFAI